MPASFLNTPGLPRGLRNNNPGNLRPGIAWQGATGENGGFLVFKDIYYGIRAMATDIGNDIRLDGKNTLRQLISEYAPPTENDTTLYINRMVGYTGFGADQPIPPTRDNLKSLIRGFMNVELGPEYSAMISDQDIERGLGMIAPSLLEYFAIHAVGIGLGVVLVAGLIWIIFIKKR